MLGRTVEEMRASLTQRAYMKWERYWDIEPWGPWRDNVHTAVIAREIRRANSKRGTKISLDQFMVKNPEQRKTEDVANLFTILGAVATPITAAEATKRRKKRNKGRAK